MTSTITRFKPTLAPCGHRKAGERSVSQDEQGLVTEEVIYACGCRTSREEFHDGSVHRLVVNHRGRVLFEEELRGE